MQIEAILILLLIGGVAGYFAGLIVKGYGYGLVGNIVVGIVGASSVLRCCRVSGSSRAATSSDRSSRLRSARLAYCS